MRKKCLMTIIALAILSGLALAQVAGDYRSVANGNWGTAATWETYDGASWVPASTAPPAVPPYANITIQAGDTVIVEVSPKRAASLKVEGTAKLFGNNTTNKYIRLWGNVTNDGEIGGSTDGLCYMCSTDVFLTGMGTTDIARLQVAAANVNITIDRPISLHYGGAALYGNNVDNVTYNVGANGQVDFGPTSYVGITTSSSLPSPYSATFNLAGGSFKLQPGMNFNMSVRSGKRAVLNLYSGLTLGDTLFAYSDSAGTEVVNIHENGGIVFSGMFADTIRIDSLNINSNAGFSTPCPIVIKGGLSLQNGVCYNFPTFRMEKNSTIDRTIGTLANKPIFTDTINVIYSGGTPCTTGYELPYQSDDAVANLTVYHELYLDSTRYVNNVEAYGGPIIANEGDVLGVFGGYGMNEADGYVIGYMGRPVPVWGGTQQVAFMVGTANGSSPATLSFTGVTKAGLIACRAIDGVHPAAKVPQEAMQRQWDFGWRPDSIADYSSASLKLYYRPEDFNTSFTEADDESTMVMGMVGEDDSTWSFPLVANRIFNGTADGGMIEADEVGPFSAKFTMAKRKTSLTGDVEPPTIVSTLPADGATGVAVDAPIYIVFSEPIDYNSFYWSITPDPSLTETWNATFDTVSLVPISGNLDPSTLYTFSVTGASDLAGNPLAVLPDSFMFTTASGDTISPFVASVSPAWEATDVGLNEPIIIVFSEPIDTNALVGFTDPFHDFTPAWSATCDTFILTPQYSYSPSSTMAVVVTAGTDLAGNSLAVLPDTIVKFTTAAGDTVKPAIVATSPADGATEVALDAPIYIVFSEQVDTLSLAGSMTPSPNEEPMWSPSLDTLFLPHDPMLTNTKYTVKITALTDLAGNPLAILPDSFMFTTVVGDTIRPYIVATHPANGDSNVARDETVYIVFSEPMNPSSFYGFSAPDFSFSLSWGAAFDTVYLAPDSLYEYNTTYTLTCTSATDQAGNILLGLPAAFGFTSIPMGVSGKPDQHYSLQLKPVAPNPVSGGKASFRFSLPAAGQVSLEVYNVLGQKVATLVNGRMEAGNHVYDWNGSDVNGRKLSSGVYIYQLRAMGQTLTRRLTVIR